MRCTCAYRLIGHHAELDERGRMRRLISTVGERVEDPACPEHGAVAIVVVEALGRSRLPN